MSTPNSADQAVAWLDALTSAESKRHEAAALAIAKTPTYDAHIIAALKTIARADAQKYARDAAKNALQKIAEAHFAAGNDIRAYLEQLRVQGDKPQTRVAPSEPTPVEQIEPVAPSSPVYPFTPSPVHSIPPSSAQPPAPSVPFDQWLLSERNIKLALYSGGLLLLLPLGIGWFVARASTCAQRGTAVRRCKIQRVERRVGGWLGDAAADNAHCFLGIGSLDIDR